jgi:hypothetical protein
VPASTENKAGALISVIEVGLFFTPKPVSVGSPFSVQMGNRLFNNN